MIKNRISALLLFAGFLTAVSPFASFGQTSKQPQKHSSRYINTVTSYRDIPGVTKEEINAVEALKASRGKFIYGSMPSTEAFTLPDGTHNGFTPMFCSLLTKLFGIPFVLELYTWEELKNGLDAKTIDFTGEITPTPEREHIYRMTYPIAERSLGVITRDDFTKIELKDMKGLKIGFYKGTITAESVEAVYPELGFKKVDIFNEQEVNEKLTAGMIDMFIDEATAELTLSDDFIVHKNIFPLVYTPVSLATANQELSAVISVVNKYITAGGIDKLADFYKTGNSEYAKYGFVKRLTDEEKSYVDNLLVKKAKVQIALENDYYPICFYNKKEGKFQGIALDVLSEITQLTGIEFENMAKPTSAWSTILEKLSAGKVAMVGELLVTEERKGKFLWSKIPYATNRYVLISKSDYPNLEMYQVVRATVGVVKNAAREDIYRALFPNNNNIKFYDYSHEVFDALESGEVDLMMSLEYEFLTLTNFLEKTGYKINITFKSPLAESFFGFNINEETLRSVISKSLLYIDTDRIETYWVSKTYNYEKKLAEERIYYANQRFVILVILTSILLLSLLIILLLLMKNRNANKRLILAMEKVERHGKRLNVLNEMSILFLSQRKETFEDTMTVALSRVIEMLNLDRISVWRNFEMPDGLHSGQIYRWDKDSGGTTPPTPQLLDVSYASFAPEWESLFASGEVINGPVEELPNPAMFKSFGVVSAFISPVSINGRFWGFVLFEDRKAERYFDSKSTEILCSAAAMCANTVIHAELEREMDEKNAKLKEALEQAKAASKSKSDFLSHMSHEMRTPMNAIIGMTVIGKKAESLEEKNQALIKITDASSLLLGVINDVLDIAKIEADRFELSHVEYHFEEMLQKVLTMIHFRAKEKQQTLTANIDEKLPRYVYGDDQRLMQVITNLLSNAVKFTPENGKINLDVSLVKETGGQCELRVEVADDGIGISPDKHERLFDAFMQADSGVSRVYGGTGLGLTITKRIIETMGGSIWLESELGKGAKFIFVVNITPSLKDGGADKPDGDSNAKALPAVSFEGKRLLIVEDFKINREILILLLKETGLIIDCVENGKEAVDIVAANPEKYDLVFMDLQMPVMDGLEATRRIRALPERKREKLPIVAMTANVFKSDIEECIAAGMDNHIGKPIDINKVMNVLQKYLIKAS